MEWYLSTSLIAPPFNMKLAWTFSYLELKCLSGNTKLLPRFLQAQNSTRTLLQPKIHVRGISIVGLQGYLDETGSPWPLRHFKLSLVLFLLFLITLIWDRMIWSLRARLYKPRYHA